MVIQQRRNSTVSHRKGKKNSPDCYTLEIRLALDELRRANIINMFLAGSFLKTEFNLTDKEADQCVLHWINTQGNV